VEIEEITRSFTRLKSLNRQPGASHVRVGLLPDSGGEPVLLGNSTPRQAEIFEELMAEYGFRPVELRRSARGVHLDLLFVPAGKVREVLGTL
jgi:hypothetical protein